MSSETAAGNNSHYPNKEALAVSVAADLLEVGSEGQGDEVVRILEMDLELLRVGDLNGNTIFHLFVSGGFVEPLLQVITFMLRKNPKVLKEVAKQENAHGVTPLQLAIKNDHMWLVNLLEKVEDSFCIKNGDGMTPLKFADGNKGDSFEEEDEDDEDEEMQLNNKLLDEICNMHSRFNNEILSPQNENDDGPHLRKLSVVIEIDIEKEFMEIVAYIMNEENILETLEFNPNLLQHTNRRGDTILHEFALSENMDMLTKLVGHLVSTSRTTKRVGGSKLPKVSLLLKGNKNGCTPLHLAINNGKMKATRYLMEVAPEAAFKVNNNGESPLYVAIKKGHDELVKYVLKVMPEASMSPATRSSLLTPNKSSLPHAAIGCRNLNIFKMILETMPSLIDSLDEKGWKPLSYASFKGYLHEVQYMLNKFPESVKKFDSDGSFPIHKAVSGGQVAIVKEFISNHPETLYYFDPKGRSILHIAVKYRQPDVLGYLRDEVNGVEKIYDLRDNDDKTFADYAPKNY